ncbi:DUF5667 domain-containing protein [Streptomyces sp. MP131-18]|uniref:DUF5667 domain-containing protein n=1 Tax=Streptomyces sp. MP131-18 TaxID=1857892 RepID=UPI00097C20E0|nr:DUF5667 domain-containing protein [Streptomyces sp. MP131-18]ONK13360.1 hypothetical protein STBA_41270 [Streptomyces sp. MP131-18]
MIGSASASRRANAFAHLLDESRPARPRPADGDTAVAPAGDGGEHAALLSVVDRLAAVPRPELSAETRSTQRALLVAAMAAAGTAGAAAPADDTGAQGATGSGGSEGAAPGRTRAPSGPGSRDTERVPEQRRARGSRGTHRATPGSGLGRLRPRTRLTKGLAAGGLTMGVAAGAFGGVAAASTDALPGDTLYGLKRGMEDLRLDFTSGDADRGRVYLDHASTRLSETRRLLERGRSGDLDHEDLDAIRRALSSMRDDAAEGHRLLSLAYQADGSIDPMRSLSAFSESHRATWAEVRERLPVQLHDVSEEVTGVFDAMDEEIAPLQPLLPEDRGSASSAEAPPSSAAHPRPGPEDRAPAPAASDRDTDGGQEEPGEDASPPEETPEERRGLLDGGRGLLDPALPGQSPEERDSLPPASPEAPLPEPDITIPPLVEDLLPGLGLDVDEER